MNWFNSIIVSTVQIMPKSFVKIFANKYIAGENLNDAIKVVKELNSKGILATIDVLGEAISTKDEAISAKNNCLEVLNTIQNQKLNSNLSIKPTQLGLLLDEDFCFIQVKEIVERAKQLNNFVRIDMEDSNCTDKTFNLFKQLKENYDNVGVAIQAYLRRTIDDIISLNYGNANFRLCKGIYIEPEAIAFKDKNEIRKNYLESLKQIFINGNYVGIATHDKFLVDESLRLINEMKITSNKFEFQMLLGVREDLRDIINKNGNKVRVYVPFGKDWYLYSIRRLKENPNIAGQIFYNIFSFK